MASTAKIVFYDLRTGGGGVTMTAVPTMPDGAFDGQIIVLRKDDAGNLTLKDETTLSGSNFRNASGADRSLGTNDLASWHWNAVDGEWQQLTTTQAD